MNDQMQQELDALQTWYRATRQTLNHLPQPAHSALIQAHTVLDVGCGAGLWLIEQAKARPFCDFYGLDINTRQIELAGRISEQERTRNAMFFIGDFNQITSPYLTNNAFDFIHVSNIAEAILQTDYQRLATQLYQLASPGGYIAWTEGEFPTTTSQALDQIIFMLCAALDHAGHSFKPSPQAAPSILFRRTLQIQHWLYYWLDSAGWRDLDECPFTLNLSARQPIHQPFLKILQTTLPRIKTFLVKLGLIPERDASRLCERALLEVERPDFGGLLHATTITARRPDPNSLTHKAAKADVPIHIPEPMKGVPS